MADIQLHESFIYVVVDSLPSSVNTGTRLNLSASCGGGCLTRGGGGTSTSFVRGGVVTGLEIKQTILYST